MAQRNRAATGDDVGSIQIMGVEQHHEESRARSLRVTHREALTLLSALELSPFDDEVLTQKLLSLVYSRAPAHDRPLRPTRDFTHHRGKD
jgi:hypothetical protein